MVAIKQMVPEIAHALGMPAHAWWLDHRVLPSVLVIAVPLPLALLRDIGFLGMSSALGVLLVYFFIAVVVVYELAPPASFDPCQHGCGPVELVHVSLDTFLALPTLVFSFICHTSMLP